MPEVVVYFSEVSGSAQVKKHTQSLLNLLDGKKIAYRKVDISVDEDAKHFMQTTSGKRDLPQVFVDGHYKGGFEELSDANEGGELNSLLGL